MRERPRSLSSSAGGCSPRTGGLVVAIEDIGDVVDLLGPRGGVAGGGAQVDVPESLADTGVDSGG
jgi:hypothetical protein